MEVVFVDEAIKAGVYSDEEESSEEEGSEHSYIDDQKSSEANVSDDDRA
jgi:heme-degrading monooxygenase HmoA